MNMNVNDLRMLLKGLTPIQLDFIRARLTLGSDAEAARLVKVSAGTIVRWKNEGVPLDEIILLAKMDSIELAREQLRRLASRAVQVLDDEMNGKHKLDAAKEVLNRVGLEPGSKLDVTSGGEPLDFGRAHDLLARKLDAFIDQDG